MVHDSKGVRIACGVIEASRGTPPPPLPPPVPPPPPPPPPARHVDVPHCTDAASPGEWGVVEGLGSCDGTTSAAEPTTIRLCWTEEYLNVQSVAVDSQVISGQPNCGDSTWNGDSLEIFIAPGSEEVPTAWMEVDVSAAGGMFFSAISGTGEAGVKVDGNEIVSRKALSFCCASTVFYLRQCLSLPSVCPQGSTTFLHTAGSGPCSALTAGAETMPVSYSVEETADGWTDSVQIPWSAFSAADAFADELSSIATTPPREWRINFYRTNYFDYGQHNPADFYAWRPTVPAGHGAAFHKPKNFGTMRLLNPAPPTPVAAGPTLVRPDGVPVRGALTAMATEMVYSLAGREGSTYQLAVTLGSLEDSFLEIRNPQTGALEVPSHKPPPSSLLLTTDTRVSSLGSCASVPPSSSVHVALGCSFASERSVALLDLARGGTRTCMGRRSPGVQRRLGDRPGPGPAVVPGVGVPGDGHVRSPSPRLRRRPARRFHTARRRAVGWWRR
eukprot:SAG22_NODE_1760_length_3634_cov_1.814144_2_plen_500_part_00